MYYEFKYFFMNHDDISNFILDNLELYIIVTILLIIWVIKSAKKNNPNRSSSRRKKNIDDLIKNDPTLQKLDKEIGDLNRKAADYPYFSENDFDTIRFQTCVAKL